MYATVALQPGLARGSRPVRQAAMLALEERHAEGYRHADGSDRGQQRVLGEGGEAVIAHAEHGPERESIAAGRGGSAPTGRSAVELQAEAGLAWSCRPHRLATYRGCPSARSRRASFR